MLRRGQGLASEAPGTRFICVADSEADIYELLAEAETQPRRVDWIVRAASDRVLQNDTENAASAGRLHAEVMRSPVLFTKTITVRAGAEGRLQGERSLPAAPGASSGGRGARGARYAAPAAPPRSQIAATDGACGSGARNRAAARRRPDRMDAADELAHRDGRRSRRGHPILLCALDDGNLVSHVEVGMPRRGATL